MEDCSRREMNWLNCGEPMSIVRAPIAGGRKARDLTPEPGAGPSAEHEHPRIVRGPSDNSPAMAASPPIG
jgi:hypothetical protein